MRSLDKIRHKRFFVAVNGEQLRDLYWSVADAIEYMQIDIDSNTPPRRWGWRKRYPDLAEQVGAMEYALKRYNLLQKKLAAACNLAGLK